MKKLIAILFALVLLLSLVACTAEEDLTSHRRPDRKIAKKEETTEVTEEEETEPEEADEDNLSGKIDGQTYENAFLGIGCTLDRRWMYATAEETQKIMTGNSSDDETYHDMFAATMEGYQVSVSFSEETFLTKRLSEEELLEESALMLEYSIKNAGYDNIKTHIEDYAFVGYDCKALIASAEGYGQSFCEYIVMFRTNDHIVSVMVFAESPDACEELLQNFYTLD